MSGVIDPDCAMRQKMMAAASAVKSAAEMFDDGCAASKALSGCHLVILGLADAVTLLDEQASMEVSK